MKATMLLCVSGITRLGYVGNKDIKERYGVVYIQEKMCEQRLRWYDNLLRAADHSAEKIANEFVVSGKRLRRRPR
ncbi:hypothetical protein Y032_0002g965 [Ancylostoma ceylanicum]|uniref:Uncharacterized protein n=1 Tax=Ancylostoma ceylanicum TaxID=53326 RepID=A0A016W1L6_9BILA|nr:hypothetical protein Y032_0002g965 [Ancylostoma ceylanicum]